MTRKKPQPAEPVADPHELAVEKAVAAMDLDFIVCRDLGHPWRKHNARLIPRDNCYEQTFICPRCGTERVRFLSLSGAILDSHYQYAEGYEVKGIGRLTGSDRDRIRLRAVLSDVKPKGKTA
jgi:hypothetical protein